jgi:hypothetical protein
MLRFDACNSYLQFLCCALTVLTLIRLLQSINQVEVVVCKLGTKLNNLKALLIEVIAPLMRSLQSRGAVYIKDPTAITNYTAMMVIRCHKRR